MIDIDEADITVLDENLQRTRDLCTSIHNSLMRLSNKSLQLEQRIKPLVKDTTKLNLYKANIDSCLALIDGVRGYAARAAAVEHDLSDQRVLKQRNGVERYINQLTVGKQLLLEINQNNMGNFKGVVSSLKDSLRLGELNLKSEFELKLNESSRSFDPQKLISSNQPFPYLTPEQIAEYQLILKYYRQNSQPADNLLLDYRAKQVVDSMLILEPFTKPSTKASTVKNPQYEKGSNGIANYTEALVCFIGNESSLMQEFYKENYQQYLNQLFEPVFSIYIKIIKQLVDHVQSNIASDGYLSFEIIESLNKILKECPTNSPSYTPLKKSLDTVRLLSQSLFLENLKYIDSRFSALQSIPNDTSVNDITVETMSRLRKLSEYREPALVAISGMKPGSWIPPTPIWITVYSSVATGSKNMDESDPKYLLSSFYSDAIDAILISLEVKAKAMLKRTSLGYFLITNYFVVETIIQRSEIQEVLGTIGKERLAKLKKRFLGFFLEGWKQAAVHLMDTTVISNKDNKSKEKDIIKDKFKNFNEDFDKLVNIHRSFRITDSSVRQYLNNEIAFIIPLYHRFHDKYSGDYFKHTEKYIKYTNLEFDKEISSL